MDFYSNQLFHIYNQGNNRRQVFFSEENYKHFLWKMRTYLPPFGDLVAYCLMPNHFHWLFYVKQINITRKQHRNHADNVEFKRRIIKYGRKARAVNRGHLRYANEEDLISLNESIGLLLQSYSQSVNKAYGWSGSLFRNKCKAKDGMIDEFITVEKTNGQLDSRFMPGSDFKYQCLRYIHNNPVKPRLAKHPEDWIFSSARDYAGLRRGTLCNLEMGRAIIDFIV
jgi:putative transposase